MDNLLFYFYSVGQGVGLTLTLLGGTLLLGIPLGIVWSILRHKGLARPLINGMLSVLRGTPIILQLSFIFYAAPGLVGIRLSVVAAGILTFGINSSAFVAEILRCGIENLPKGQIEAAKTLGIPPYYIWKDIIFPQVLRAIFPSLLTEMITLMKETALIGTIGGMDIMRMAQTIGSEKFIYFTPLCIAGLYYYIFGLIIERAGNYYMSQKKDYSRAASDERPE